MAGVHIININTEDFSNKKNFYYIGKNKFKKSPLSNPFGYNPLKSSPKKLIFKNRDQAIDAFETYFKTVYGQKGYEHLTEMFDDIYEHYKKGEDIYLGCTCYPLRCHGEIIAKELEKKLIRERLKESKIQ